MRTTDGSRTECRSSIAGTIVLIYIKRWAHQLMSVMSAKWIDSSVLIEMLLPRLFDCSYYNACDGGDTKCQGILLQDGRKDVGGVECDRSMVGGCYWVVLTRQAVQLLRQISYGVLRKYREKRECFTRRKDSYLYSDEGG